MLFRLDQIHPGKTVRKDLELNDESLKTLAGTVTVSSVAAQLKFRTDPQGYVMHYDVTANAEPACIRCGEMAPTKIEASDWISLRTQQPEDATVVLNDSEMNVRFIYEPALDLREFVLELIELELPSYPRHQEEDPNCQDVETSHEDEDNSSPFQVLSKFLDK